MLAIFDIDGTICDTQSVEDRCFAQAFEEVFEFPLETVDWTKFEEPTSSGIVRSLCSDLPDIEVKELVFRDRFVDLLKQEQPLFPGDFTPLPGAMEFIEQLTRDPSVTVAFATGCFDTEAEFKLECCGITIADYPHATSSDTPRRRDIIPLAANRAGIDLSSAIYFGDAPWDVKACEAINIPMIGIGRRIEELGNLGLSVTFPNYLAAQTVYTAMQNKVSV